MTFPILVEPTSGQYTASLLGTSVRVEEPTQARAVASVKAVLRERIASGELLFVDLDETVGVTALTGTYADDPTLLDIVEEAYRLRDEEREALPAEWDAAAT